MVIRVSISAPKLPEPIPSILLDCGFEKVAEGLYLGKHLERLTHELNLCGVLPATMQVGGGKWAVAFPNPPVIRFNYSSPPGNPIEATLRAFRQTYKAGVIVGSKQYLVRDPLYLGPVLASQGFRRQGHLYVQTKSPWLMAEVDDGPYGSRQITLRSRQQELFSEQTKKGP